MDEKPKSEVVLKGCGETEQLMFINWSDYNTFRGRDRDRGLWGLHLLAASRSGWTELSVTDCWDTSVY